MAVEYEIVRQLVDGVWETILDADTSGGGGGSQDLGDVLATGNDAGGLGIENLANPLSNSDADTKGARDVAVAAAISALSSVYFALANLDTDGTLAANSDAKVASQKAVRTYVAAQVAALVASAPGALDTLDELAAALGDDANFAATVTTALAGKQPLDATLTALAAASWVANSVPVGTGSDTLTQLALAANTFLARSSAGNAAAKAITDYALTILDDADAATARATLGVIAALFQSGGAQAIKLDDLATPDDNTDLNVSTSRHGLAPKAPNDATKFLDGTGAYTVPAGGGGGGSSNVVYAEQVNDFTQSGDTGGFIQLGDISPSITIATGSDVKLLLTGLVTQSDLAEFRLRINIDSGTIVHIGRFEGSASGANITSIMLATGLSSGAHTFVVEFNYAGGGSFLLRPSLIPEYERMAVLLEEMPA